MIGVRIGPYRILAELGRGGAATVYRAEDLYKKQEVAIKLLAKRWAEHPRIRRRFECEAAILARLNHPGVPRYLRLLEYEGSLALVEELCTGLNLQDLLGSEDVIHGRRCVPWLIKALDALQHLHDNQVIHRDIKPGNIMVVKGGVKLLDFGLAQSRESASLNAKGTTVGTIYYISREQAQGQDIDLRTDIYASGATLYHLVTGTLPYDFQDREAVIRGVLHQEPTPPSELWPLVDEGLEGIILKAMRKDPRQRFQSAREMALALAGWWKSQAA